MGSADSLKARFGLAVRRRRIALGYSQEHLAELAGVHRTYMGAVERGERNVSLANMSRIAEALQVTLSTLVRDAECVDS